MPAARASVAPARHCETLLIIRIIVPTTAQIFLVGALLSEVVSGGSLFTSFAQVDVQAYGVLAAAMVVGGAGVAVASRPAAIGSRTLEELTSAWVSRSLFSRSLTTR